MAAVGHVRELGTGALRVVRAHRPSPLPFNYVSPGDDPSKR
jgi:hypothetical protein